MDRLRARLVEDLELVGQPCGEALHTVLLSLAIMECSCAMKHNVRLCCIQLLSDVLDVYVFWASTCVSKSSKLAPQVASSLSAFMMASGHAAG